MTINDFIKKLKENNKTIDFKETMALIDSNYTFTETAFTNGEQNNAAGENSGSCKVFSFGKLHNLNQEETLLCFGQYYQDVLNTPEASDHQNIRQFMLKGWNGIEFEAEALSKK